jgi:hypothetical protein
MGHCDLLVNHRQLYRGQTKKSVGSLDQMNALRRPDQAKTSGVSLEAYKMLTGHSSSQFLNAMSEPIGCGALE